MLPSNEEARESPCGTMTRSTGEAFDPKLQFGIAERFCLATQQAVGTASRLAQAQNNAPKLEFDIVQDLVSDKMNLMTTR